MFNTVMLAGNYDGNQQYCSTRYTLLGLKNVCFENRSTAQTLD